MNPFPRRCASLLLAALMLASVADARAHSPSEDMAEAANNLLAALKPEQKAEAKYEFKNAERENWHFIPRARKGLAFKAMSPDQLHLAQGLIGSAMSSRGLLKTQTIMSLEQILFEMEQNKGPKRDAEMYFITIFGEPGKDATWGWRLEGHHLSLNFTIVGGKMISVTPSFMGTNPAEVREGPRKGLRVLKHEEEIARKLVKSLNAEQKAVAIYTNTAPADVITAADRKARVLEPAGLAYSKLNPEQQNQLFALIREYVERYRPEIAKMDLDEIEKAGRDKINFAWAGGLEERMPHYYRIQGPTFLMEYDNTQNNANHVHAVWRSLQKDFGDDLLRKHYDETPHK